MDNKLKCVYLEELPPFDPWEDEEQEITFYIRTINRNQVILIQNWWRKIYNNRIKNANIIKKAIREAIANPNTQLCKNRLLHEFNGM